MSLWDRRNQKNSKRQDKRINSGCLIIIAKNFHRRRVLKHRANSNKSECNGEKGETNEMKLDLDGRNDKKRKEEQKEEKLGKKLH